MSFLNGAPLAENTYFLICPDRQNRRCTVLQHHLSREQDSIDSIFLSPRLSYSDFTCKEFITHMASANQETIIFSQLWNECKHK